MRNPVPGNDRRDARAETLRLPLPRLQIEPNSQRLRGRKFPQILAKLSHRAELRVVRCDRRFRTCRSRSGHHLRTQLPKQRVESQLPVQRRQHSNVRLAPFEIVQIQLHRNVRGKSRELLG